MVTKLTTHVCERIKKSKPMAKGKYRCSDGSNRSPLLSNGGFKSETYSAEFEINETPPGARTLLTKGYVQDEINAYSGATVSTRGRFMTESEKRRRPDQRPLYLFVQGHSKQHIDLALRKIEEIIDAERQSCFNLPSGFAEAPPSLASLHSGILTAEKIFTGMDEAPASFDARGRILGPNGANLVYIGSETGATIALRGRGSRHVDQATGCESSEPLHLYIEHKNPESLRNAKQLGINLIETVRSELQSYGQQQPALVQQRIIESPPPVQPIQQAHFQTMNIGGALSQSNVVTIQHQDIIQHPQSSVVTLPATILTATMPGGPGSGVTVPPPGVHIPAHAGPLLASNQTQELRTFVSPPPIGQVQLVGPPPNLAHQFQYQIHSGQSVQVQMPPSAHLSPQTLGQMYVMSQPPPLPPNHSGCATTSPQLEAINVNLHQPPPAAPTSSRDTSATLSQQPPPSLLHLHFPPPNFAPNHPPPPIPQTYRIQYQQLQPPPTQTRYLLRSNEHSLCQTEAPAAIGATQQLIHPQFPSLQVPPPTGAQTFLLSNDQTNHSRPPPGHPPGHQIAESAAPQPVPPPQMVPPPDPNAVGVLTSVPPPPLHQQNSRNAPWLYPPPQPLASPLQPRMHYQPLRHQQSGQAQSRYALQPPPVHSYEPRKSESPEHKPQGVKRRFDDVEGPRQEAPPYQCGPPLAHRQGNGEGAERQQRVSHGRTPGGAKGPNRGDRNTPLLPPPHPGEKRSGDRRAGGGPVSGKEENLIFEAGTSAAPWQTQQTRMPWTRTYRGDTDRRILYPPPVIGSAPLPPSSPSPPTPLALSATKSSMAER